MYGLELLIKIQCLVDGSFSRDFSKSWKQTRAVARPSARLALHSLFPPVKLQIKLKFITVKVQLIRKSKYSLEIVDSFKKLLRTYKWSESVALRIRNALRCFERNNSELATGRLISRRINIFHSLGEEF